jgi:hypothetical protein
MAHPPCVEACDATARREAQCGQRREDCEAKNEEDERAAKKTQQRLQVEIIEENRRRRSTTFTPPDLDDFQIAADTTS